MPAKPKKNEKPDELNEPVWAVVSFEGLEAGELTYAAARERLAELDAGKKTGLCIVTGEAAARLRRDPRT
jgi:hypothetical protein